MANAVLMRDSSAWVYGTGSKSNPVKPTRARNVATTTINLPHQEEGFSFSCIQYWSRQVSLPLEYSHVDDGVRLNISYHTDKAALRIELPISLSRAQLLEQRASATYTHIQ
jgi:hypothetical protein